MSGLLSSTLPIHHVILVNPSSYSLAAMSDDKRTLNASCLCGAANHRITLPASSIPLPLFFCHCTSCRHMTGTLAYTVTWLPEDYKPAQETLDVLTPFEFTERTTQYHCSTCGTQMLAHCRQDADNHSGGSSWAAVSGTLEKLEGLFELKGHEFVEDTLDGGFADFLTTYDGQPVPRWARNFGEGEILPPQWERPDRPKIKANPTDRCHAHCKCGGVEFWIARPSERSKEAPSKWHITPDVLIPHHSNEKLPDGEAWWLMDNGKKYLAGVCACNSCRLHTGMEFVEWAFVSVIDITLDQEGTIPFSRDFGSLKGYRSSDDVMRYHCDTCGATVFFFGEDRPHVIDVAAGLLDAPEGARAQSWLEYWCGRLSFREDALPRAETLTLAVEKSLQDHGEWKYPFQKMQKDSLACA